MTTSAAAPTDPPSRGAGRPRDETIEHRVLPVVRAMLIETGYDELSVRGVAARAGVGRASILRRWASKPELVLHAVLGEVPDLTPFAGTDRRGWVEWVLRGSRELFARPEVRAAVPGLLTALDRDPDLKHRLWSGFSGPAAALLAPADADPERAALHARALIALAAGSALFLELVAEDDTGAIHEHITRLILDATVPDPKGAAPRGDSIADDERP
ncbi:MULTISPECIES: TetR/AcrR family transcriptional regulator [Nocardia]|uniref:Bacterial regulatory proteins, tetR family n=2 Tax=Nocardia farcinica TaxID=37329 RepID=A0A0H5NLM3_NOCFR|nr:MULTISPECIES: TetR/AcrR family transcriptional regulator [Nocardia]AXK85054.1 TetR/AcrR family transcriptional regulator [Nocardia farcinica]MBA4855457.1 TetR/AcrR family transcriptional regulator [Nocardia farcinica]MBC9818204.1 TetR/AcrR family transcriptional regulator [Nocardia farcinica]MBF6067747.1 TetR/AcrR family transcriptional regulator [Nocardia farcinica]MBF6140874.1 TetR/AcrR family transcriptional regulator [Nocardia farcinica]